MIRLLEELGYVVTHVRSGTEALACINQSPDSFEFVCAKVILPGLDAFELLELVRAAPGSAQLPFLMLSYPPNESESYAAWNARQPRYYVSEDGLLASATLHDGREFQKLNREDIIGCIYAMLSQLSDC